MTEDLIDELLRNATPSFQTHKKLSGKCPKCHSQLVLKYRINLKGNRKLGIILACSNDYDKLIWNTDAEEVFTHWWLDSIIQRDGYDEIIALLPSEERNLIMQLKQSLMKLNL